MAIRPGWRYVEGYARPANLGPLIAADAWIGTAEGRVIDFDQSASMETKKVEGYF